MSATYRICSKAPWPYSLRPSAIRHFRHQATAMSTNDLIEEETLPSYCARNYCPVSIGEVFNGKYKVVAKLGFGRESTTWLAQDITR